MQSAVVHRITLMLMRIVTMKTYGVRSTRRAGVNANDLGITWLAFINPTAKNFIVLKSSNAAR